jgi:hypothetical protein
VDDGLDAAAPSHRSRPAARPAARPGLSHRQIRRCESRRQCRMRGTDSVNDGISASKASPSAAAIR